MTEVSLRIFDDVKVLGRRFCFGHDNLGLYG